MADRSSCEARALFSGMEEKRRGPLGSCNGRWKIPDDLFGMVGATSGKIESENWTSATLAQNPENT